MGGVWPGCRAQGEWDRMGAASGAQCSRAGAGGTGGAGKWPLKRAAVRRSPPTHGPGCRRAGCRERRGVGIRAVKYHHHRHRNPGPGCAESRCCHCAGSAGSPRSECTPLLWRYPATAARTLAAGAAGRLGGWAGRVGERTWRLQEEGEGEEHPSAPAQAFCFPCNLSVSLGEGRFAHKRKSNR